MVIRHLKAEDQAVFLAFCQDFYSGGAVLHAVDPDNFRRTFEACVSGTPYTEGFLLEVDGQPAGYILVSHTWSNEVGGMVALLEELYFTPEFRGKGLGTQALEWFREQYASARRLRLEVNRENEGAIRLYQRKGYHFLEYLQMVEEH